MLLDPRDWALASRSTTCSPRCRRRVAEHAAAETHGSALELATGPHAHRRRGAAGELARRCARGSPTALEPLGLRAAVAGHAPVRAVERHRGLARRALPVDLRLDARARPARADLRAARPRRRARTPRPRCARCAACARTCRCCSRSPPTRRSGRAATPASPRRACRSSATFPRVGHPARRSPTTPSTSRRSTCCCAAARSPSRRSCGGTCGCSRASARSRCGSWTPRRASADNAALAALVQCLVRLRGDRGRRRPRRSPAAGGARREPLPRRARRDATPRSSTPRARLRAARCATSSTSCSRRARPHAAELGCEAELARSSTLAAEPGYQRQRIIAGVAPGRSGRRRARPARRPRWRPTSPPRRLTRRPPRLDLVRVLASIPCDVGVHMRRRWSWSCQTWHSSCTTSRPAPRRPAAAAGSVAHVVAREAPEPGSRNSHGTCRIRTRSSGSGSG